MITINRNKPGTLGMHMVIHPLMLFILFVVCNCAGNRIHYLPFSDDNSRVIYHGINDTASSGTRSIVLFLQKDNKYKAEIEYVTDADNENVIESSGTYVQKNGTIELVPLDSLVYPLNYRVGEGSLISEKNDSFVLEMVRNRIFETRWRLVELKGSHISSDPTDTRDPSVYFKIISKRAFGSGGCNRFSGVYDITDTQIRITGIISTKMACMGITYENEYFSVLESVNSYSISGDTLLLTINGSLAARFTDAKIE